MEVNLNRFLKLTSSQSVFGSQGVCGSQRRGFAVPTKSFAVTRCFWFPEGFWVPARVFSVPAPGGRERHSPGAIDNANDKFRFLRAILGSRGWLADGFGLRQVM